MTDYMEYVYKSLGTAEDTEPCATCDYRENCWSGADRVIEAALKGEQDDDSYRAADAYTDSLSDALCPSGKDSLVRNLLVALYRINNPPLFVPHMEDEDNEPLAGA